jgi:YfiH family protein
MPPTLPRPRAPVLRPSIFSNVPAVRAGVSTRRGGVSGPPYDTLNLGRHVGDDPVSVEENRRRFCAALDTDPAWLVTAGQVHGATVRVVEAPRHEPFCDGLVTATPRLLLAIATADCAPVLLADPAAGVVGACHAGWRGAVAGVAAATVTAMQQLGATPAAIRAHIGPCLSREAFEVGPEVAARFDEAVVHWRDGEAKPHVDLTLALRRQLESAGLTGGHIDASDRCTLQEPDTFFSYRGSGGTTGRMFGAVALRP